MALIIARHCRGCFSVGTGSSTIAFYRGADKTLSAWCWARPRTGFSADPAKAPADAGGGFLTAGYITAVATMRVGRIFCRALPGYTSLFVCHRAGRAGLWRMAGLGHGPARAGRGAGLYTILRNGGQGDERMRLQMLRQCCRFSYLGDRIPGQTRGNRGAPAAYLYDPRLARPLVLV